MTAFADSGGWTWLAGGFGVAEAPRPDGAGGAWFSDLAGGVFDVPAAFASSVAFDGEDLLCTVGAGHGDRGGGLLRASVGVRGAPAPASV